MRIYGALQIRTRTIGEKHKALHVILSRTRHIHSFKVHVHHAEESKTHCVYYMYVRGISRQKITTLLLRVSMLSKRYHLATGTNGSDTSVSNIGNWACERESVKYWHR